MARALIVGTSLGATVLGARYRAQEPAGVARVAAIMTLRVREPAGRSSRLGWHM